MEGTEEGSVTADVCVRCGMAKEFKAVPYQVTQHHEADELWPGSPPIDDAGETRFCIVSTETGEILDDAQGYGYKTAQKAYKAYAYKTRDKSKDEEKSDRKKHIIEWMKEHEAFVRAMDNMALDIQMGQLAPDDQFDSKLIQEMLREYDLHPDFSASELLKVWRDR